MNVNHVPQEELILQNVVAQMDNSIMVTLVKTVTVLVILVKVKEETVNNVLMNLSSIENNHFHIVHVKMDTLKLLKNVNHVTINV
jgi:hypothetical protein